MKKQLKNRVPALSGMMTLVSALAIMMIGTESLYAGEDVSTSKDKGMISEHQTIATFEKISYEMCYSEVVGCPEHCSDSGEFAVFKIEKYIELRVPNKKWIRKHDTYRIRISDYNKKPVGDDAIRKKISTFKVGDRIALTWHEFETQWDRITKLEKSSKSDKVNKESSSGPGK